MYPDDHSTGEESGRDSDASSDTSSSEEGLQFIDDEAEESDGDASETPDYTPLTTFSPFKRLPIELRLQVWDSYCKDMAARPRVLCFIVSPSSAVMRRPHHYSVKDHWSLADQTRELRRMLATHGESRRLAARKFPDELRMDAGSGDAVVRFNKARDVVNLHDFETCREYHMPGFADQVHHVAIDSANIVPSGRAAVALGKTMFPNLQRLYSCINCSYLQLDDKSRGLKQYAHSYRVETFEEEDGLGEDTLTEYRWPDMDRYKDFARRAVPDIFWPSDDSDVMAANEHGVELLPMMIFDSPSGMCNVTLFGSEHDSSEDDDGESLDTDSNQYESEGIDDSEIDEQSVSSEDEFMPTYAGWFSSPEVSDDDDGVEEDVAPVQRLRKRKIVSDSEEEEPQMERSKKRKIVSDSEEDSEEEDVALPVQRLRKGRIVSESEEDSKEDDVVPVQRLRKGRIVSDSEEDSEEEEEPQTKTARSRTVIDLDSDSDGGGTRQKTRTFIDLEDGEEVQAVEALSRKRPSQAVVSVSDSEDDDDDDSPREISLMERLTMVREEQPVSSGSEDDSEDDSEEEEEEEEGEEGDDEDDDSKEGLLLEILAGEKEEDDDDDNDDEGW
ncbi:hypothetical protein ED733_000860 [Metarhizium rileyi]|uniref:2EXR domain-containing protein n=1 Tax=Metarhizium rileyi (strain RCEF 4871) TaxID=1649241 RepID=A0A5C6G7X7_METRR|nr:hypothetical protein ED733_000860 [Metarhizium rileyi]